MCVEKCYRPNVAAIILSSKYPFKCEFFIARRKDLKNVWQFPQGGIDTGETPKEALFRELKEEIGCDHVNIIAEYPHWITYDFPNVVSNKMYPFDGQRQKYFLVRLKKGAKINLSADKEPEFREWRYVNYEMMLKKITYYKRQNYIKVIEHFVKEGYI
ncbi:MAG: RNA pyrophosphohydrolase [Sulfurovum sp. AS07-7]|jgi:putative (di)nucleoside polyphosphate hydrolase|nr:MAG: RNA pyrophosphohydrolase [Sulfurovum sp. AS07-7]TQV62005.1 MAG: RNA pyrophosphohydrolase [Sulfurovum sp.]